MPTFFPFKRNLDPALAETAKKRNLNRIRDHLANERTYLSWMRSAIALMGFGVLIVRMRILRPPFAPQAPGNGWKLGLGFAIVGLLTVLLSTQHYFAVRDDIEEDTYAPARSLGNSLQPCHSTPRHWGNLLRLQCSPRKHHHYLRVEADFAD